MKELSLSIGEPFTSPAWSSNFVQFTSETGAAIVEAGAKEYLRRCCKYARSFEVHLVPERFWLMGYQCMCLIGPDGKVIGAQKALYAGPSRPNAKRSASIDLFATEFGSIFLCVDVDVYRPETARIASAMGAQFIFASQQIMPGDYGTHMILSGAWNAAQLGGVFVSDVTNEYHCVCAPIPLTPMKDGFISPPNLKLPLTVRLVADRLERLERPRPLTRKLYASHRDDLTGRPSHFDR